MRIHSNEQSKQIECPTQESVTSIEREMVKQLDYVKVMPYIFVILLAHHFDIAALSHASVLGLLQDTHISLGQYGFLAAISALGHLVAQIPNTFFIQKFPIGKYLGVMAIIWGINLALTSVAKNFAQLVALRFFLGFFGSGLYPCSNIIISRMYRRKEQTKRLGVVIYGNGIAVILGGFIGYGIGHMKNIGGLHCWQWLMIIYGLFTIFAGMSCFFFMADNPKSRKLNLTPEQEEIADKRIADNAIVETRKLNYNQIKESLKESRYYCYILALFLIHLQSGAIKSFFQILISSFGFQQPMSLLLAIPPGVYAMTICFFSIRFVGRYGNRHYVACTAFGISALGVSLLIIIPVQNAKLICLYLATTYSIGLIMVISSITNNVMGSTKKTFYLLSVNTASVLGDFIGPLLMIDSQKPSYTVPMIVYIVSNVIAILLILLARRTMSNSNKKRYRVSCIQSAYKQYSTDKDNFDFIYKL